MSEIGPKITLQVTLYLQIHTGIQNPVKHLKWSRKKRLGKNNCGLKQFPKDRDINTVTLLNIPGF